MKENRKYTRELLQEAAANSTSVAGVLRFLGLRQAGGTQSHISRKLKELNVDTEHFTGSGHNRGKADQKRKTWQQVLILTDEMGARTKPAQLRRALADYGLEYKCQCGISSEWLGSPIQLEVDHIDGRWWDNTPSNLRFLCPNCHSQQETTNRSWKYKPS